MGIPAIYIGYNTFFWPLYLVCIAGAISQAILMFCLIRDPLKCFRNSATYLIVNLAVCDLVVVLQMLSGMFGNRNIWLRSTAHTSFYASILTVVSISIDRYIMVAHPFKHRIYFNGKKVVCWIAFVWVVSFSCPVSLVLSDNVSIFSDIKYACLAAAIILTISMYTLTIISLKTQAKSLENKDGRQAHKFRVTTEERFQHTVMIIAAISVVCLTPVTIHSQMMGKKIDDTLSHRILDCIFKTLLAINFSVNPIIYFVRLQNYRKTFFIVLCRRQIN